MNCTLSYTPLRKVATDHIDWCKSQGMTVSQVFESIDVVGSSLTWERARIAIERKAALMLIDSLQ